jgi:hypothetical protein
VEFQFILGTQPPPRCIVSGQGDRSGGKNTLHFRLQLKICGHGMMAIGKVRMHPRAIEESRKGEDPNNILFLTFFLGREVSGPISRTTSYLI